MCDKVKNNLIRLLKYKNHPNILLYNLDNHTFLINILNQIYNITPTKTIIDKDIEYKSNNIYYEIDMSSIKYKYKNDMISIIKDILYSDNVFSSHKKIIILNNFSPNKNFQDILKVIIEKNHHVIFIIVCKKITHIIDAIKSRFINIRIPKEANYIKNKSSCIIKYFRNTNNDILNDIINRLFKIYDTDNIKYIVKTIKEFSYILVCINIPMIIFLKYLIDKIINKVEIVYRKVYQCIYFISEFEYKYNKSFYKMLHYEYLLLNLYNIIKT